MARTAPGSTTPGVLCQRGFRLFLAAQGASQTGTWVQLVALAWLTVQLTGSGIALGWITAAMFGPLLVFGPWTGALVDRCDTLRLLLAVQAVMAGQSAALTVATLTGTLSVPGLFLLAMAHGLVYAVENPARQAFLAEVVPADGLARAVGLKSAVTACGRVLGPLAAGGLMTTSGVGWCFALNAVSSLLAVATLAQIGEDRNPVRSAPGPRRVLDGLRHVRSVPELRAALALTAVVATFGLNHQVVVPLLAERTFNGGAGAYTLLYTALSAGSVCGALLVGRADIGVRFLGAAAIGFGAAAAAVAAAPTLPLAIVASVAAGGAGLLLVSGAVALLQVRSDPALRGQVMALAAMVVLGGLSVGGPVVGWVSEQFGPRWALGLGAATALVAGAAVLVRTGAGIRRSPAGTHAGVTGVTGS